MKTKQPKSRKNQRSGTAHKGAGLLLRELESRVLLDAAGAATTKAVADDASHAQGDGQNPQLTSQDSADGGDARAVMLALSDTRAKARALAASDIDSDGDGVLDGPDIDDDNDGILDQLESQATSYTPDAGSSTEAGQNSRNGIDRATDGFTDGAAPHYYYFTRSNSIDLMTFSYDTPVDQVEAIQIYNSYTMAATGRSIGSIGEIRIYDSHNVLIYSSTAFSGADSVPDSPAADPFVIDLPPLFDVGRIEFSDVARHTKASSYGIGLREVNLVSYTDVDHDSDGVVDRLDLDSDNDGITDNVEAQSTGGYIAPSGQGTAMTDADGDGLDDNYDADAADIWALASGGLEPIDTEGDKTADYLDTDSDNDGALDIAERSEKGPTSITSTTDSDGDGLLNIFEGSDVSDGYDANDENVKDGVFTLADSDDDIADDGSDAAPLLCDLDYRDNGDGIDSDGDGLLNNDDIDDDNDGLLDSEESSIIVRRPDSVTSTGKTWSGYNPGYMIDGNVSSGNYYATGDNDIDLMTFGFDDPVTLNSIEIYNNGGNNLSDLQSIDSIGEIRFYDADGNLVYSTTAYSERGSIPEGGAGRGFKLDLPEDIANVARVEFAHCLGRPGGNANVVISEIRFKVRSDSDGDGNADSVDIDSDNDGITDNVEAQTTEGYVAPSGVDADRDGLDDSYDSNTQDKTGAASVGLTPVDTDADKTADYLDADSDNDGVLDIAERSEKGPTSITDSTDTDGDGLLDIFEGTDADDGYDVNDDNVTDGNFTLSDSDNDTAADGSNAKAPAIDLDYRDNVLPPVATGDIGVTDEDTELVVDADAGLLANDVLNDATAIDSVMIDTDGDDIADKALTLGVANEIADESGNVIGRLTINADGAYSFDPAANFHGLVPLITYTLRGASGIATANLTITVTSVKDVPIAVNDTNTTAEDTTIVVNAGNGLLANDSDGDGDRLSVTGFSIAGMTESFTAGDSVTLEGVGELTINADGSYRFVPAPNYHGSVPVVTYTVSDGDGGSATATLSLSVTAVDDTVTLGGLGDGSVDGTDGEVDEANLAGGSDPSADDLASRGTFSLGPITSLDSVTIGGTLISVADLLASGESPITITGEFGTLVISGFEKATGNVSYVYTLGEVADHSQGAVNDGFVIGVTDVDGDITANAGTLAFAVIDDTPTAAADRDETINVGNQPSSVADGNVLTGSGGKDPDSLDGKPDSLGADGGAVTGVAVGTGAPSDANVGEGLAGSYGTFTLNADGSYTYVPDFSDAAVSGLQPGESLSDTFTYRITDGDGDAVTTTVTLTLYGSPAAVSTDAGSVEEAELGDGSAPATGGAVYDGEFIVIDLVDSPLASISIGGETFTLEDLEGFSDSAPSVKLLTDHGYFILTGFTLGSDSGSGVRESTVSYRFVLTETAQHGSDPVTDSVDVVVTDSLGNSTKDSPKPLAVEILDDGPDATKDDATIGEDASSSTVTGDLIGNDTFGADGEAGDGPVTGVGAGKAAPSGNVGSAVEGLYGKLTVNADGSYSYALDNANAKVNALQKGETLTETFTYQITDGDGDTTTATLTLVIQGANDAPTASADPIVVDEDGTASGTIVGTDVDGDDLSFTLTTAPENGTLTLNTDGSFTFVPDPDFNGTDSFEVTVTDGHGGTTTITVPVTVTPVNDAPVAGNDSASTAEDTPLTVAVDDGLLANDSDVDGDSLSVTGFSVAGMTERFAAGDSVTIEGVGELTINADGSYRFVPAPNYHGGVPVVTYTIADGDGLSDSATLTLGVTAVDDKVTVGGLGDGDRDGTDGTVDESALASGSAPGGAGLSQSGSFTLGPASSLSSVTIGTTTIGIDELAASGDSPIRVEGKFGRLIIDGYDATTGTVSYVYTLMREAGHRDGTASDRFVIGVTDVDGDTVAKAGTLAIAILDDAPTASGDSLTVGEDGDNPSSGSVLSNDVLGADGAKVSAVTSGSGMPTSPLDGSALAGNYGALMLNPDGSYSYRLDNANADVNGLQKGESLTETFTYEITDADGDTSTARLTITIMGANDGPEASSSALVTMEGTPVSGAIDSSDVDGDQLSYGLAGDPAHGDVTLHPDGTYTYTPDPDFNGTDSFVVTVDDGNGGKVDVTVSITVTPINDAPVAANDSASTAEDTPLVVDKDHGVLANDSDVEGDPLSVTGFTVDGRQYLPGETAEIPGVGSVTLNSDGSYRFDPAPNFNGDVPPISYRVGDSSGGTDTGTLALRVTAVDDQVVIGGLGDGTGEAAGSDGRVEESALATGTDAGGAGLSQSGTFSVGPVDSLDSIRLGGTTISLADLAASHRLPISIEGEFGRLIINGFDSTSGVVSYCYTLTRDADHSEGDVAERFVVGVTDVDGDVTADAGTLAITILDDAPLATDDSAALTEDAGDTLLGEVMGNDGEGADGCTVTGIATSAGASEPGPVGTPIQGDCGVLVLNADGSYRYVINNDDPAVNGLQKGESLTDSFTYWITDGDGDVSSATLTITIAGNNDIPVVSVEPVIVDEDGSSSGTITATDVDGDDLSYTLKSPPASGTLILNEDGTFTFTPGPGFNGSDSFVVTVSDGHGGTVDVTVPVTVTAVNDAPEARAPSLVTETGDPVGGTIDASDIDGDDLTFGLSTPASHGEVSLAADGSFIFVPNPGFSGSDSFVVAVSDGHGGVTYVTVEIVVKATDTFYQGEYRPRVPSPVEAPDRSTGGDELRVDGIVEQVVNEVGDLGGLPDLGADGVVLTAVNAISDLQPDHDGGKAAPMWGASALSRLTAVEGPGEALNGSIASADGRLAMTLNIERERAWLSVQDRGAASAEVGVSLADGRALPGWIHADRRGVVTMDRPAGVDVVELGVSVPADDGAVLRYRVRVDLNAGQLSVFAEAADRPTGASAVPSFSEQLSRAGRDRQGSDDLLRQALKDAAG
ncbi:Ig-like domain-containing protein [Halomonas sp. V046]|uniref:Ig-like domain-containing protein n=1 Tax=Halomonas sp. V046 TaxID=3459611 RepID=UPI0040443F77